MSIVTKKGDEGYTLSFQGKRIKKNDKIIKFSSVLDETISFLGVILSNATNEEYILIFRSIQKDFLSIYSLEEKYLLEKTKEMEKYIDDSNLKFEGFIIPGKNKNSALIHYARSLVRKCEIAYLDAFGIKNKFLCAYLNRLSDYLFIIAEEVN